MSEKLVYLKTDDPEMRRVVAQLLKEKDALRTENARLREALGRIASQKAQIGVLLESPWEIARRALEVKP